MDAATPTSGGGKSMSAKIKRFQQSSHLYSSNAPYLEDLYDRYREDPQSVPGHWRELFEQLEAGAPAPRSPLRAPAPRPATTSRPARETSGAVAGALRADAAEKQGAVLRLINAYRVRGHQRANVDPLGLVGLL